ncbi:MAG: hypothetical protein K2K19_09780, partial [Acetatifactor sp.]|nr:hypothetical protein [Acetatifactor sp.]
MKFLNLLDITVEISLLIVLIGTINRLLKKELDPNIRYFLWIFVAIRLLLPLRIELSVELPNVDLFDTAAEYMQDSRTDETATAEAVSAPLPAAPVRDITPAMPQQPPSLTDAQTVPERIAVSGKGVAQFVWILGMVALSGYVLVSNGRVFLSFRKNRRKLEVLDNKIPVYAMPGYNCLAGIVSPAIYVDTDVLGSSEVIQNVISHELQHYRAKDHYWQLLRVICLILQWHNPLMWWAYFASRKDCEIACDARVVRNMTSEERFGYGSSLLTAAEIACRRNQAVLCSTSMSGNKSFLRERIHGIMQYKCKYAIALITVIILVIGVGCFASFHLYANEEKGQKAAPENSASAESEPENRPKEPLLGEEITPVAVNIADYYITNTGYPSNLYYIDENNVLWGCGRNNCGQLGQGTQDYDFHEDMVKIAEHVIHVDYSYEDFMVYLTEDHKLYGVGNAGCGALQQYEEFDPMQYANGEHYTVTTPCLLMENVVYARCGRSDVACLTEDSEIWVFGTIGFDRTEICYSQYPVKVLEDAAFVTGGFFHHAALLRDGSVWTWGYNYAGGCGVAGGGIVSEPTKVAEHIQMVWTGNMEYNVDCQNIADLEGIYKRQMENTIILTNDGEYMICGANVGT